MTCTNKFKLMILLGAVLVFGVCFVWLTLVGNPGLVFAEKNDKQIEEFAEEGRESEITTRGGQMLRPSSSMSRSRAMKKALPLAKSPLASEKNQILLLQQQVNALEAQVNALQAIIQVSNGMVTVQAKVIQLQGDSVILKSLKDGVTINSNKDLKIEAKNHTRVKASNQISIDAGSSLAMKGIGVTSINGSLIKLNNGEKAVLSTGSIITTAPVVGGPAAIGGGSSTVLVP